MAEKSTVIDGIRDSVGLIQWITNMCAVCGYDDVEEVGHSAAKQHPKAKNPLSPYGPPKSPQPGAIWVVGREIGNFMP